MAPVNLSHRRTHNLLLISKLLGLRDTASPFTLLLDSLEQPATPLIKEYIRRARVSALYYYGRCLLFIQTRPLIELTSCGSYPVIEGSCYSHCIRNPKTTRGGRYICLGSKEKPSRYCKGGRLCLPAVNV